MLALSIEWHEEGKGRVKPGFAKSIRYNKVIEL